MAAALDVVQLDLATLIADTNSGADPATIAQDTQTEETDFGTLVLAEQQFVQDSSDDQGMDAMAAVNPTALRTPGTPGGPADA